jgi:hypothetical protein
MELFTFQKTVLIVHTVRGELFIFHMKRGRFRILGEDLGRIATPQEFVRVYMDQVLDAVPLGHALAFVEDEFLTDTDIGRFIDVGVPRVPKSALPVLDNLDIWIRNSKVLGVIVCKQVEPVDIHTVLVMIDPRVDIVRFLDEGHDRDPVTSFV